jgi:RimJ/RimL family protein N-acetyltransferase
MAARRVSTLRVSARDDWSAGMNFAQHRGFHANARTLAVTLDLDRFDDWRYEPLVRRLESEGFRYNSMEALGDTDEARRALYRLNEVTGRDIPGTGGAPPWASFADFRQRVCQAAWYRVGGQLVVIDETSGRFVAMSAISRFEDHAPNLHTGVNRAYHGRKLAQAVRTPALNYARDVLRVREVRTHHDALNLPMIAIDRKFG